MIHLFALCYTTDISLVARSLVPIGETGESCLHRVRMFDIDADLDPFRMTGSTLLESVTILVLVDNSIVRQLLAAASLLSADHCCFPFYSHQARK